MRPLTIWTIGHSNRTIGEFIDLLRGPQIEILVDVRRFPGSRAMPQFNPAPLEVSLAATGVRYEHMVELGGRRKARGDSHNDAWRSPAFRGYADYMESEAFRNGIDRLLEIAHTGRTAIMCAEAVWWRCHRALISDYLKAMRIRVLHILSAKDIREHPYTSAAHLVAGHLSYQSVV